MPKKLLRRWLPHPHHLRSARGLRMFGRLLANQDLWSVNRRSVARAGAVGLFIAFIPVPAQMVFAAGAAIWLRINLPVAVSMVWVTNPLTIPFIFYGAYRCGSWLLDRPAPSIEFEASFTWLYEQMSTIWAPLLLGSLVLGVVSALVGYLAISVLWRVHVIRRWRERRAQKRAARARYRN
ncbi:MAG: hypothetical protein ACI8PT_004467 [Gammaproteobacteria bacterium]|jgi:uncharacterized protein (DUF2062 family)